MFGSRPLVLSSPYDPVAIAHLLQHALTTVPDAPGVFGAGSQYDMELFFYRPRLRNALMSRLVARMTPDGTGTRIDGRIGAARSSMVFMGCWLGFVALFLAGGVALLAATRSPVTLPFLVIPGFMLSFGIVAMRSGRTTARTDEAAILAFLADTIGARPVNR